MPSATAWLAFVGASLLFIQVPGPSLLFTIGRALTVGRREALLSVLGNASGLVAQVLLVAGGLGALVTASATAYTILKLAGATYVIWLGLSAIRRRADARHRLDTLDGAPRHRERWDRAWLTGFLVGVGNPKTIVFFVAFLPQFVVDGGSGRGLQIALLGLVFVALAAVSDSIWALTAGLARTWVARRPERLDHLGVAGGVMMVGLGATLAVTE